MPFVDAVQRGQQMSESEAVKYVYQGDSSKLYCEQRVINMENERDFYLSREKYIPRKIFRIAKSNCTIIATLSYQCKEPNDFVWQLLLLEILDRGNVVKDSLLVHRANDYDYETTGAINLKSEMIFLMHTKQKSHDLFLYRIDGNTLRFVLEQKAENVTGVSDNPEQTLKKIGWLEKF